MTTTTSSVTTTLAATVDNLTLTGTADINGTGNGLSNTIVGNAGANVLHGRAGADTLAGGDGNDTQVVDNAGDVVVENQGEGSDTVQSSVAHTLGANVENLTLTGSAHINGTGNALDNVISGNGGNNALYGMDGNDTLVGNAGNDILNGGIGADNLQGGLGDDTYVVDNGGDSVAEGVNGGTDTVQSSISYALGDNFENLTLTGIGDLDGTGDALNNIITGNSGDNALTAGGGNDTVQAGAGNDIASGGDGNDILNGDSGNDTLNGGVGADTMAGGIGDDMYVVDNAGDVVTEDSAAGTDTAQSSISYTLTDNLENLTLTGTAAIDGMGNVLSNIVHGNAGANILDGLAATTSCTATPATTACRAAPAPTCSTAVLASTTCRAVPATTPTSSTTLLANDTDPNAGDVLSVVAVGASAVGASVSLGGGAVQYDIGDRFQQLAQGEVLQDSFSYTITDDMGIMSTSVVAVDIIGVNDAPVVSGDAGAVTDDVASTVSGNVLLNDTDIDNGTVLQVAAPGTYNGIYGALTIAQDGSYTYSLNGGAENVQRLAEGEVATDQFSYVATDGIADVSASLVFTVTGTNDAPVVVGDAAQVTEDSQPVASGNVLAGDHDLDAGAPLAVAAPGTFAGNYGTLTLTLTLAQDGSYTYSLDNEGANVQSLAQGQTVVDSFTCVVSDGTSDVSSVLDITITGTNDVPVVSAETAAVSEDLASSASGNVLANHSDVDAGTVLTVAAPGTSAGIYGSLSLAQDGSYTYSLNNSAANVQSLALGQAVVDSFTYATTDGLVVDKGDTLTYSAQLSDGSALPTWLKFDATTGTFSGTAPKTVGDFDIRVTATDKVASNGSTAGSLSVSDVFHLAVGHQNNGGGNDQGGKDDDHDHGNGHGHGHGHGHGNGNGHGDHGNGNGNGDGHDHHDHHDHDDHDDDDHDDGSCDSDGKERNGISLRIPPFLDPRQLSQFARLAASATRPRRRPLAVGSRLIWRYPKPSPTPSRCPGSTTGRVPTPAD